MSSSSEAESKKVVPGAGTQPYTKQHTLQEEGNLWFKSGKFKDAIRCYTQAIEVRGWMCFFCFV
jgi:hypothetical protein